MRILVIAALVAQPAFAAPFSAYNVAGCGEFLKASQDISTQLIVGNYVRGYLTAYNAYNQRNQISRELSDATAIAFVEKYCKENPLADVSMAPAKLVKDLGGRGIPN